MPKVTLTAADRQQRRIELAEDEFRGVLGKYKAKRHIRDKTYAEKLKITAAALSKRLRDPLNQLSIADFIVLVETYGVTNEEIIGIIRKGVSES